MQCREGHDSWIYMTTNWVPRDDGYFARALYMAKTGGTSTQPTDDLKLGIGVPEYSPAFIWSSRGISIERLIYIKPTCSKVSVDGFEICAPTISMIVSSLESNSHCVTDPRIDRQRTGQTKKIYLGRISSLTFPVWFAPWPRDSLSAEGGRKWLTARREGVPMTVAKLNSSIYLKLRLNPPFRFRS